MLEFLAGAAIGGLVGTTTSQQANTKAIDALGMQVSTAIRDLATSTRDLAISTEATGHREVVKYVEYVYVTGDGKVINTLTELQNLIISIKNRSRWDMRAADADLDLQMINPYTMSPCSPEDVLIRHGFLYRYEVFHFWNVVVGLNVRRLAFRCLPDGMAREIHSNPEKWR